VPRDSWRAPDNNVWSNFYFPVEVQSRSWNIFLRNEMKVFLCCAIHDESLTTTSEAISVLRSKCTADPETFFCAAKWSCSCAAWFMTRAWRRRQRLYRWIGARSALILEEIGTLCTMKVRSAFTSTSKYSGVAISSVSNTLWQQQEAQWSDRQGDDDCALVRNCIREPWPWGWSVFESQ
jgi:hypothetical protein